MKILQRRKNIRLKNYDYSQNGAYFITFCIKDKLKILSEITINANCVHLTLSKIGQIVNNEFFILANTYEGVFVDKYVIMPDHIHLILLIENEKRQTTLPPAISRIIKQFKGSITKKIGFSIWHRSFYDCIIRTKEEYLTIWNYIDNNPKKWAKERIDKNSL